MCVWRSNLEAFNIMAGDRRHSCDCNYWRVATRCSQAIHHSNTFATIVPEEILAASFLGGFLGRDLRRPFDRYYPVRQIVAASPLASRRKSFLVIPASQRLADTGRRPACCGRTTTPDGPAQRLGRAHPASGPLSRTDQLPLAETAEFRGGRGIKSTYEFGTTRCEWINCAHSPALTD